MPSQDLSGSNSQPLIWGRFPKSPFRRRVAYSQGRTFTPAELAEFDGKNGRPAYVAVNGTVYDVTNIPSWMNGVHAGLSAGRDLTAEFGGCHDPSLLAGLPKVGVLA